MKRYKFLMIAAFWCVSETMNGQSIPVNNAEDTIICAERIYVATDRGAYLAGETMWLSLYCVDANDGGTLSATSEVAYLEFYNASDLVLTAKTWLSKGRGAGSIELPTALPTGNYILKAYTKHMYNELVPVIFEKTIPVYNALTNDRVEDNVAVSHLQDDSFTTGFRLHELSMGYSDSIVGFAFNEGGVRVNAGKNFSFLLENKTLDNITTNVSVFRKDSVSVFGANNIVNTLGKLDVGAGFRWHYLPDLEGEVISGRVVCDSPLDINGAVMSFSVVGEPSLVFMTLLDRTGGFEVYTPPFFGNRKIVVEFPYLNDVTGLDILLDDSYIKEAPTYFPKLLLNESIASSLLERSIEMQIAHRCGLDTIYQYVIPYKDPLLKSNPVVYKLDDYVRFPAMQEVIVEFIPELRYRKREGKTYLQVRLTNEFRALSFADQGTLVLLDGVPVFDHSKILEVDPLKIESISIYTDEYSIGHLKFTGVVIFNTYNGNHPGISGEKNTFIKDFDGMLYPSFMSVKMKDYPENLPDLRSLLYWNPMCNIDGKSSREIVFKTSSKKGEFIILVEGISANGNPFFDYAEITVL